MKVTKVVNYIDTKTGERYHNKKPKNRNFRETYRSVRTFSQRDPEMNFIIINHYGVFGDEQKSEQLTLF